MITPIQQKIRDKSITAKRWADMVRSGDWICPGSTGSESTVCEDVLAQRIGEGPGQVKDIEFWTNCHILPLKCTYIDPEEKYHCIHQYFWFNSQRQQRDTYGTMDFVPYEWAINTWQQYYRFFHKEKDKRRLDWTIIAVSPPENGHFNLSYGTCDALIFAKSAKKVILEVREDYPWAEGGANNIIYIDDIDYIVEVDCEKYRRPILPEAEPGSIEKKVAENILKLMQDGDCIQLGIGELPTAVARGISGAGLKHLGIHTEMFQEGIMSLIEAGCVDNSLKSIDRGKSVWNFAFPTNWRRYYDFIHHNHSLAIYDVNYTNNINVLSKIDNMVAIDNFLAIDLQGQLCSGCYAGRQIAGTGGFFQFLAFCGLSKGGRSIATATSTKKLNDGRVVSRIVPEFPGNTSVDVPATFTPWVATEYGIVNLWGLGSYERTKALISIAHPEFRDELEREARKRNFLPKNFPIPMIGPERRYPEYKERRDFKSPYTTIWQGCNYENDVWCGK